MVHSLSKTPRSLVHLSRILMPAFVALIVIAAGCKKTGGDGAEGPSTDTAAVEPGATTDTGAVDVPAATSDTAAADVPPADTAGEDTGASEPAAATDGAAPSTEPAAAAPPAAPKGPAKAVDLDTLRSLATKHYEERRAAVKPFTRFDTMLVLLNRDYGIDYRARFPDGFDPEAFMSREEILLRVEQELDRQADVRFPPERRRRLVEEAKKLFPLYRKGDTVKILVKSGRSIEGEIQYIGADFVQIGFHKVAFADIVEPDSRSFDPEKTQELRDGHVQAGYDNDRRAFIARERRTRIPKLLEENGFVNVDGEMMRIDDVITQRVMPEVTRMERAYISEQEKQIKADVTQLLIDGGFMPAPTAEKPAPDIFADVATIGNVTRSTAPSILLSIEGDVLTIRKSAIAYPPKRADLVKIMGEPTREVPLLANQMDLVWDDLGISASINETNQGVDKITVFYMERDRSMRQFPKSLFTGKLQIEGTTIDRQSNPETINSRQASHKYTKVENRTGLWRSERGPFVITITMEATGLQTVRLVTKRE